MTLDDSQTACLEIDLPKPKDFAPHWNNDLSDQDYHLIRGFVGSSSLRKIRKSPATFKHHFEGGSKEPSKEMKFGTIAHGVILLGQEYLKNFVVIPKFIGKTKDGRDSEQSAEAKLLKAKWFADLPKETKVISQEDLNNLEGMVDAILSCPKAFAVLKDGQPEIAGFWRDEETGVGCKIKPDFLSFNLGALLELKTTSDCTEEVFMRQAFKEDFRYDIQLAMYAEGVRAITGKYPENRAWIAIEKEPPYEIAVHEADEVTSTVGAYEFRQGLLKIKSCIDSKSWPKYSPIVDTATPPPYIVSKYQLMGVL